MFDDDGKGRQRTAVPKRGRTADKPDTGGAGPRGANWGKVGRPAGVETMMGHAVVGRGRGWAGGTRPAAALIALMAAGDPPRAAPARAPPVKLGLSVPLSGPDAVYGDQVRLGVEQAVADVNAAGGLLGRKLQLETVDDGGDPKKGLAVARSLIGGHVQAVIGPFSSAVAVPASALYAEAGVLDISPSATAPLLTERGLASVFRTSGREDGQAAVAARWLLAHGTARVALVHDRTETGKDFADAVRRALAAAGTRDVFYGGFDKGAHDLAPLVARIKASGAQVVLWGGGAADGGVLARQLRDANVRATLMGGVAMASDEFATQAGPAAEGSLIVFPPDPRRDPLAADLLRRFHDRGVEPGAYTFSAYAAVEVIQQAAAASRSLDGRTLAETMRSGTMFNTVLGAMSFDDHGDPTTPGFIVYVWRKGAGGRMAFDDPAS